MTNGSLFLWNLLVELRHPSGSDCVPVSDLADMQRIREGITRTRLWHVSDIYEITWTFSPVAKLVC